MSISSKLFLCFIIVLAAGCGGGSGGSGTGSGDTVTVNGSIGGVITASSEINNKSVLYSFLTNFSFIREALANHDDLEGITIQVFDGDLLVDESSSSQSGEFSLLVPCGTPLTLVFTNNGNQIEIAGVTFPCTDQNSEVSIVITLNFDEEDETEFEIEEEASGNNAFFVCNGGDELLGTEGENLIIEGNGDICLLTSGNCHLTIIGANLEFNNCEKCIDTRGSSQVRTELTGDFICNSEEDGIKSVGNSLVDITVVTSTEGGGIFISSSEDGVDSRGNSTVNLNVFDETESPFGQIVIDANQNALKGIGNADIELIAGLCDITGDTELKGNGSASICE